MKKGLKIVTIGGGSSYTPELMEGFIRRYNELPLHEIWLVDVENGQEKVNIDADMARRMWKAAGHDVEIHVSFDRKEALKNADFVTTTTHKTLRGPRGGMVFCKEEFAKKLDSKVFPGMQGGPLEHVIAAKGVCLYEASQPEFKSYMEQTLKNVQVMCKGFKEAGFRLVSGGSDNHLLLVDVLGSIGMTGKEAERLLDLAGITCNKNTIPYDTQKPFVTSGIRLGAAAMTTRGFKEKEFEKVTDLMIQVLKSKDEEFAKKIREEVLKLTQDHPAEATF